MLPMEDLTAAALTGRLPPIADIAPPAQLEDSVRALYRRTRRHVIVTGPKGVGKTTFVRELARIAASGRFPFLQEERFIWVDCQYVAREDSRACLESILQSMLGRPNLVLCLDGLAALLRRPSGEDNKQVFKAALARSDLHVIGILSKWEFNDLIGSDAEMLEYFTRIELEEPHGEVLTEIVRQIARQLEQEFAIEIPETTVQRTLTLCSGYVLNENFPAKAARLLRHVCEDIDFERTQRNVAVSEATSERLAHVIAGSTGIPATTLMGQAEQPDFEAALSSEIFGQDEAVAAVATELRLIRAGLVDPNKPATVLLLAGMTGVGKTELAKRLAELYSTSRRLQTYPMGNFTEPHSVSGIIGVPPGYVGHEQGGRLVNDLNSDPYSVFLLDEGEKAHPNIWVPFLNLFDEGWLIDQRGRKAYADRAIFILTTNAGADAISQMTKSGHSSLEIEDRVRQMLSKIRHERSSQAVFTPQFLARIKKVLVFRPLDADAMLGICRKLVGVLQGAWLKRRDKHLQISEDAIRAIAAHGHALNEKSGGREGGRIIRKLLSESVESRIQMLALQQADDYGKCHSIRIEPSQSMLAQSQELRVTLSAFDVHFDQ
jgi:ATP-dependent Clp protease ATP-binding subunit ClpA